MRTILIQKPTNVRLVLVQGRQDAWEGMSEMLSASGQTAQERHYAQLVEALTQAVGLEYAAARGKGWCALWILNVIEDSAEGDQCWRTWISVDDDWNGERTFGALMTALEQENVPFIPEPNPVPLPLESHPVHARCSVWCFGPRRGSFRAELRPANEVVGVEIVRGTRCRRRE